MDKEKMLYGKNEILAYKMADHIRQNTTDVAFNMFASVIVGAFKSMPDGRRFDMVLCHNVRHLLEKIYEAVFDERPDIDWKEKDKFTIKAWDAGEYFTSIIGLGVLRLIETDHPEIASTKEFDNCKRWLKHNPNAIYTNREFKEVKKS